jgi:two-component system, sensor histidine kinase and response regulator
MRDTCRMATDPAFTTIQSGLGKPQILIVEDSARNIQVLGNTLAGKGYEIFIARNGAQALEKVDVIMPDLILLDVMMPELDGFEICRRLKSNPVTAEIPVVFLTGRAEPEDIVKGFKLGAVDYLTKPFNPDELLVRVNTQLELQAGRKALKKANNDMKELVHLLCHDLANPMNSVISVLDTIDSYEEFESLKDLLRSSAENGLNVIGLVRDMRCAEENALPFETVDLAEALRISTDMLRGRFTAKRLKLAIDVPEGLLIRVEKTSFVNSVLNNLFTNAIKFSHPGSKIEVRAARSDDRVRLTIQDHGIGIPGGQRGRIFDFNTSTSRPGTDGETGNGFGMPMVRKFILAYQGTIEIDSIEQKEGVTDHGTKVRLLLPAADTD